MSENRRWQLQIAKQCTKVMSKLPRPLNERLNRTILALADDPWPAGCKHLQGYGDLYRVRAGDWRIVYEVRDAELVVLVIEVAARGSAYRDL